MQGLIRSSQQFTPDHILSLWEELRSWDELPVKIKFEQDTAIPITPIIVLLNKEVFPRDKAFSDRLYKYQLVVVASTKVNHKVPTPIILARNTSDI